MNHDLIFRDECYRIIGACLAVYQDKGNGFVEPVYQDALEIELELAGVPFDPQRNYPIHYGGGFCVTPIRLICFVSTPSS